PMREARRNCRSSCTVNRMSSVGATIFRAVARWRALHSASRLFSVARMTGHRGRTPQPDMLGMPADHALNHRRLVDELISAEKPAGGISGWRLIAPNVICLLVPQ